MLDIHTGLFIKETEKKRKGTGKFKLYPLVYFELATWLFIRLHSVQLYNVYIVESFVFNSELGTCGFMEDDLQEKEAI